jgi:hypothetical protein
MRGRLTFGLFIIVIGILILLRNMNVIEFGFGSLVANFWPLLLIIWGLGYIFERIGVGGKVCGVIIMGLGLLFLGRNLGWFTVDFSMFWKLLWPAFLIFIGIAILTKSFCGGRSHFALMSGIQKKGAWRLEKGVYWDLMGSIDLDLRQAELPDGDTTLQVIAFMGSIDILVPPGLAVICEGTSILGGVGFFDRKNGGILANLQTEQGDVKNSSQIIRINCLTVMGGVEVKAVDN